MSGTQPPLNIKNAKGELIGLDVELATALADAMNVDLVLVEMVYYVRTIEVQSLAVGTDAMRCTRDESGQCTSLDTCVDRPTDDDCQAPAEERAGSSPIFVAHTR